MSDKTNNHSLRVVTCRAGGVLGILSYGLVDSHQSFRLERRRGLTAASGHHYKVIMPVIKTKTTYLQMFSPPAVEIAAPRDDVKISKVARPTVEFYRRLYNEVGSTFYWVDRLVMQDEKLLAIINHDLVDVLVLTAADEPLGYAELDRRQAGEIELAYFGLFPSAIGQGLGKYLLNQTVRAAWAHSPQRVWVHTCDLDHAAALPNYLKAGFEVYDEVAIDQCVPEPGENGR